MSLESSAAHPVKGECVPIWDTAVTGSDFRSRGLDPKSVNRLFTQVLLKMVQTQKVSAGPQGVSGFQ